MSFESPVSVLYNSEGLELALSQSQVISASAQPGLVIAGSGSDGRAYFMRVSNDGALFITGSIQTSAVVTQSVFVGGYGPVTGAMKLSAWQTDVTGAVGVTSWVSTVTGNMKLDGWGTGVTGAVNLASSASVIVGGWASGVSGTVILGGIGLAVTASTREIGAATTNVSSANASTTNFTLLSANPSRLGLTLFKEGSNTCYVKFGATATATSYTVKLTNNSYFEVPDHYTGRIDIIFSSAVAGNILYVTELLLP